MKLKRKQVKQLQQLKDKCSTKGSRKLLEDGDVLAKLINQIRTTQKRTKKYRREMEKVL